MSGHHHVPEVITTKAVSAAVAILLPIPELSGHVLTSGLLYATLYVIDAFCTAECRQGQCLKFVR